MNEPKEQPVAKVRDGALTAAIWRQEGVKDGRKWQMHSVTLERAFQREGSKEWEYTNGLGRYDLLSAAKLLDRAHSHIVKMETEFRAAQRAATSEPDDGAPVF
jgi:hypothetical protein